MIIPYDEVQFVWVSKHYDIHLNGLCRVDGKLCEFTVDYPNNDEEWLELKAIVRPLKWPEKFKWLIKKKAFEWCVGYHWSYPERLVTPYYVRRKPYWFFDRLFDIYYGFSKFF